jgi:hypothetical protein
LYKKNSLEISRSRSAATLKCIHPHSLQDTERRSSVLCSVSSTTRAQLAARFHSVDLLHIAIGAHVTRKTQSKRTHAEMCQWTPAVERTVNKFYILV